MILNFLEDFFKIGMYTDFEELLTMLLIDIFTMYVETAILLFWFELNWIKIQIWKNLLI